MVWAYSMDPKYSAMRPKYVSVINTALVTSMVRDLKGYLLNTKLASTKFGAELFLILKDKGDFQHGSHSLRFVLGNGV